MGVARILTKVEEICVWLDGLPDPYIAMIPKVGGVLLLWVIALCAAFRLNIVVGPVLVWCSWRIGFGLGFLTLCIVLVVDRVLLRLGVSGY